MTQTVIKCILFINILISLTEAALVRNQGTSSQQQQQNSIEDARFPSRSTNSHEKEKNANNYNQVNNFNIRVLDNFDHRYPDGSYEFRYELSDGQARYEKGYFVKINEKKSLVVVGYYSYRMPDGKYVTVFYNADRYGYRQNQAITRDVLPDLPRSIEVPVKKEEQPQNIDATTRKSTQIPVTTTTTTKRSRF
ncbi:uncharacterized protein ACRADG_008338 [Cochliomyia hominivorax]